MAPSNRERSTVTNAHWWLGRPVRLSGPGSFRAIRYDLDNEDITLRIISRMNQKKEETGQARNGVLAVLIVVGGLWLLWLEPWWVSNRAVVSEVLGTARVVVWWAALAAVLVWVGVVVWAVRCWWVGRCGRVGGESVGSG